MVFQRDGPRLRGVACATQETSSARIRGGLAHIRLVETCTCPVEAVADPHRVPDCFTAARPCEPLGRIQRGHGGAKPSELPIEQPTKFGLLISMRTAKALKLTIPPELAVRADRMID